jgi:hypothetical protein
MIISETKNHSKKIVSLLDALSKTLKEKNPPLTFTCSP